MNEAPAEQLKEPQLDSPRLVDFPPQRLPGPWSHKMTVVPFTFAEGPFMVSWAPSMDHVTLMLDAIEQGQPEAAEQLLPVVYQELRRLAAHKMAGEALGHTLQPTALVHEAWLRLLGQRQDGSDRDREPRFLNRQHFFASAAEAMRRILVDHARRKKSLKRGSGAPVEQLNEAALLLTAPPDELLAVHEALDRLAAEDTSAAELVKLRYFVGMTMEEAASAMGLAHRSAERLWTYARSWLKREISDMR